MTAAPPQRRTGADLFDLTGKRVVVTGASRGIGQAICLALCEHGANVFAVARSEARLAETQGFAKELRGSVSVLSADLCDAASIEFAVARAVEDLGGIDILVNNAGYDNEQHLEATTLEEWQHVFDLNVRSVFLLCQAAGPYLADGGGKVINVASMLGQVALRSEIAYVASKHAVVGFTRALALEWARKGVQVNALGPGFVQTEMLASATRDENTAAFLKRGTPMGRWAQPEEMAGPAVFLATRASDFMTGQLLIVDGGWTAQ